MAINIYICNKVAKITLRQKIIIRQFLGGVLLFVFTFSIAPKKFLHDAIANHKDKIANVFPGDAPQLSNTGFICKCDNLVAESPFVAQEMYTAVSSIHYFATYTAVFPDRLFSSTHFFFTLRGPPAGEI